MLGVLKRMFVGRPLATTQMEEQRLSKTIALAVFSSDALSSTAYASEEILFVVAVGGSSLALGLSKLVPIAIVVAVLLSIVVVSYRQVIFAYPNGGGAYVVSQDNLGVMPVARRGGVAHGRLRPDRRRVDLGRRRRDRVHPAVCTTSPATGWSSGSPHRCDHAHEHAWHQGVGPNLRHPDLRVHVDPGRARSASACSAPSSATSNPSPTTRRLADDDPGGRRHPHPVPPAQGLLVGRGRAHRHRGDLQRRPLPSDGRSRGTRRSRSCGWACSSARCSSACRCSRTGCRRTRATNGR